MSSKSPRRHPTPSFRSASQQVSASTSLRQLLDSLSREQRRNQDLLVSLGFALRSFTN
ncbi:MAG: serine/threonine protein phosphatase, partial [Cyanobacteriota bacterium]|nr:serine/threonine protein phosphatase [Cyanobacteriota bacterium]